MALYIFLGIFITVTVISNLIQYQYQCSCDFADFLIDDYGWINILSCVGVGGIVAGFIFWSWKIMLIIVSSLVGLGVIAGIIVWIVLYIRDKHEDYEYGDDEYESEEIISSNKSIYKCKNCGATLLKQTIEDYDGRKTRYFCEHCETSGSLKEIRENKQNNETNVVEEIDISDFEEEYFNACIVMGFRPHNKHTQKQIDRKYDKLIDQVENGEIYWEDDDRDDEDILDEAYDFFIENLKEIDEYLEKEKIEDIRKKYEYYISDDEDDED